MDMECAVAAFVQEVVNPILKYICRDNARRMSYVQSPAAYYAFSPDLCLGRLETDHLVYFTHAMGSRR